MNEMKNAIQSIYNRTDEVEERIFEVVQSRRTEKNEESLLTCGIPSKEAICELSAFQKEQTGRGKKKVY